MCVHYIVIPFSISEAMIWFHNRLLMYLWTCKGTGFYFIEDPVHSLFDRTLSHAGVETSGSPLHYRRDLVQCRKTLP